MGRLPTKSLDAVARELRRHDNDRYLTALFAPAERREGLMALYVFNLEVAKTAELVSEPMLGRIRLQWWRDSLEALYAGAPRQHYVITPLARVVETAGLPRALFERIIDAREFDLERRAPRSMVELETYVEGTSSTLIELALVALGEKSGQAARMARPVGLAYGLVGLVRAVPSHAAQKRLYIPEDVIVEVGLERRRLFELASSSALCEAAEHLGAKAAQHLQEALALQDKPIARSGLAALLPGVLAARHLGDIRKAGYDPFHPDLRQPRPGRLAALLWAYLRGRI
jgi:phytoene synthase